MTRKLIFSGCGLQYRAGCRFMCRKTRSGPWATFRDLLSHGRSTCFAGSPGQRLPFRVLLPYGRTTYFAGLSGKRALFHLLLSPYLLMFLGSRSVSGQPYPRQEINVQELLLQWAPVATEERNYEEIYEGLYSLYQNPLDLNRAEREDLSVLFFLNERQISELLEHRQKFGRYLSLYELQTLESLKLEEVRRLIPFVTVYEGPGDLRPGHVFKRAADHYLVIRADMTLEKPRGFKEEKYAGSRQRWYTRYRLSRSKDFSVGFISEKDPGEKNFLDYTAFHLQLQNKGNLRNLVVGDFLLQMGQGLVFSAGYAAGKGGEPVYTTRRSNLGAKPYNSLVENGSFRGLAITYGLGKLEVTAMASMKRRDASVRDALVRDASVSSTSAQSTSARDGPVSEEEEFSSLLTAGMHRTEAEIAGSKAVKEQNFGGNVSYKLDHLRLGLSVLHTRFNRYYHKRDLLYNFYEFEGKVNTIVGPNLSVSRQNFSFFAEAARSSSGGYGYLAGLVGSLGKQVEVSLNHRNYRPDFHTLYGSAFSEGSRSINEKGIYAGLKYRIRKGWEVAGYYDSFRFPWLKYRVDGPSYGQDHQLRMNYKPVKKFSSYLAYRADTKVQNASGSTGVTGELREIRRQGVVLSLDYSPGFSWKFQSKLQYNAVRSGSLPASAGWAWVQDIETRFRRIQWKMRVACFATDSYDSRVYAYENDVLYAVSFPAYYGRGLRWYGLLKVPLGRKTDAWLRLAQTRVADRDSMGSGNDLITGNVKTDARVQVRYRL